MKISAPYTAAQGSVGTTVGGVDTAGHAPDAIQRAKAAAAGEKLPMKITKSDNYINPEVARQQTGKRIKLQVNHTIGPREYKQELLEEALDSAKTPVDEQVTATTEDTKPLSPQFARLAKDRRALQVKERELADREKALNTRPATDADSGLAARLKSEPLSVLLEHGITYEQLTQSIMSDPGNTNPELYALKAEIKALKEGIDKSFEEKETQAEQQVLATLQREAAELSREGDAYEMVRETGSLSDVMELITRTYKQTGEVLDVQEALGLVEDHLVNESLKIANINKIKGKLTPAQIAQEPQQQLQPGIRTLTNRDNAAPILDRKARALAAFYKK